VLCFFDLLPEAIELGSKEYSFSAITSTVVLGFVSYMILDRLSILHKNADGVHSMNRANLGAGSLSTHSFLDGIGIGLAFQISTSIGVIVAVAVMVHDISDGLNTVSIVLKNEGKSRKAKIWTTLMTVLGIMVLYMSIKIANM